MYRAFILHNFLELLKNSVMMFPKVCQGEPFFMFHAWFHAGVALFPPGQSLMLHSIMSYTFLFLEVHILNIDSCSWSILEPCVGRVSENTPTGGWANEKAAAFS